MTKTTNLNVPSVSEPFQGDYVDIRSNMKWQKLYKSTQDISVVFADSVSKINRADGKVGQQHNFPHTLNIWHFVKF